VVAAGGALAGGGGGAVLADAGLAVVVFGRADGEVTG
jgi:hypothetical protein